MLMEALNEWREVRLEDVCERITVGHVGSMANEYVSEGVPFLRSQNITPFKVDLRDVKYITPDFNEKLRKSALKPGDVAVVRTGNPGTAAVIPRALVVSNCSDLVIIRPGEEVDSWFLSCLFNSVWGKSMVAGNLVGVAQQHFNVGAAKNLRIRLPPIQRQRTIASILRNYDDLIENNTRRIEILEEMARRLYEEWFVQFRFPGHEGVEFKESELGLIPASWEVSRIGESFITVLGGTPSRKKSEYWEGGDIPWIASGKANELRISLPTEYITEQGLKSSSAKLMPEGTTVLAITGATLGQVSILLGSMAANQSVVGIYDSSGLRREYIYRHVQFWIWEIIKRASGGAQQHINKDIVNESLYLEPDTEILSAFNNLALPVGDEISNLIRKNDNLRSQRNLLLPKLISGEIDVSDIPMPT